MTFRDPDQKGAPFTNPVNPNAINNADGKSDSRFKPWFYVVIGGLVLALVAAFYIL